MVRRKYKIARVARSRLRNSKKKKADRAILRAQRSSLNESDSTSLSSAPETENEDIVMADDGELRVDPRLVSLYCQVGCVYLTGFSRPARPAHERGCPAEVDPVLLDRLFSRNIPIAAGLTTDLDRYCKLIG